MASIADDFDVVIQQQTSDYRPAGNPAGGEDPMSAYRARQAEAINKARAEATKQGAPTAPPPSNPPPNSGAAKAPVEDNHSPFIEEESAPTAGTSAGDKLKAKLGAKKKYIALGACGLIVCALLVLLASKFLGKDRGPDWMRDIESGEPAQTFEYTFEERESLRAYGYTADDIEANEILETSPYILIEEAKAARKRVNDESIKPYLDGASEEFNKLKEMTWLGCEAVEDSALSTLDETPIFNVQTYNVDYKKIPAMGKQLMLKLYITEWNEAIFMNVSPERYNELADSGNIVVTVEYSEYSNGSIFVTSVMEKNITY